MNLFSDEELAGLYGSSIFQAIPEEKYCHVFACLKADKAAFEEGSILYGPGSSKKYAGILLDGVMEECLYDEEGNQIGTAMDNINDLEAGGTWKFEAVSWEEGVASYRLAEISGF